MKQKKQERILGVACNFMEELKQLVEMSTQKENDVKHPYRLRKTRRNRANGEADDRCHTVSTCIWVKVIDRCKLDFFCIFLAMRLGSHEGVVHLAQPALATPLSVDQVLSRQAGGSRGPWLNCRR